MNAYDEGFRAQSQFRDQQKEAAQQRALNDQTKQLNDYKLKRIPIEDQQADAYRAKAQQDAADLAKRQAQMRGLVGLKNAMANGMDVGHAITAMGPGALTAFGNDFGSMADFANQVRQNPKVLDARIAALTGDGKTKKVVGSEYVKGPGGEDGLQVLFDDGTTQYTPGYGKQFAPEHQVLKQTASGDWINNKGDVVVSSDLAGVRDLAAAKAEGTATGKEGGSTVAWTPVQKIAADTTLKQLTLKNQNLNNAIDKAIAGVDWNSAGLAAQFKEAGGPPANLAAFLQSVGAQVGLDELTKLKQSGVTLGQVTEAEHALLQSMIANLSQIQDPQALREALQQIKQQSNKAWRLTRDDLLARSKAKGGTAPDGAGPDPESTNPAGEPQSAVQKHAQYFN